MKLNNEFCCANPIQKTLLPLSNVLLCEDGLNDQHQVEELHSFICIMEGDSEEGLHFNRGPHVHSYAHRLCLPPPDLFLPSLYTFFNPSFEAFVELAEHMWGQVSGQRLGMEPFVFYHFKWLSIQDHHVY